MYTKWFLRGPNDDGGGGAPPAPPAAPPAPAAPAAPPEPPVDPKLDITQSAFDKALGERLKAQRTQFESALGVPLDEAKKILAAAEEDRRKNQTAAEQAAEDRRLANELVASATEKAHTATIVLALVASEVEARRAADIARLVDCPVGADEATVAAAIATTKAKYPEFFGKKEPATPPSPTPGNAPSAPPAPGGATDDFAAGLAKAKAANQTKSYFD